MTRITRSNNLRDVKVLVLDDEQIVRNLVAASLKTQGAQVTEAEDGWRGLQELFDHCADVLVVDIRMPKMDGIAFLQEALKIWPWLGVVVITGVDPAEVFSPLLRLGVTCILQKPFTPDELIEHVTEEYRRIQEGSVQEQRVPLRRIQQQLQILRQITRPALESETLLEALRGSSEVLARAMDFAVIGVCGHEKDITAAIFNIQQEVSQGFIDALEAYLLERYATFAGQQLDSGLRIELTGNELVEYGARNLGSTFCVPIISGGNMQGFLILAATEDVQFDAAEVSFVYTIANHLSTIFAALDRMRSLAIHDPLTGLCNRLHLEAEVGRIWSWSQRHALPMAVLIIDLDHFKSVNDTYGHQTGDRVLQEFAQLLRETSRASDVVGRYGGEEFVVVLPEADQSAGMIYANRLMNRTRQHVFRQGECDLHLTISIGLSIADQAKLDNLNVLEVLDEADRAMYVAKHAGRNCVRCWSDVQPAAARKRPEKPPGTFGDDTIVGMPLTRGTILVVDDDPVIRSMLREVLSMENYEVSEANDGDEALKHFEHNPGRYDLMLVDIQMPRMNGLELIKRAKMFDDTVICIVISGYPSANYAIESLRKGAYDFIEKPLGEFTQLLVTVNRAMEYHKALVENRQYQRHLSEMVREKSAQAREALQEVAASYSFTLEAMMGLLDARERGTGVHSKRVRDLALRLAKELKVGRDEYQSIATGALLHDIGKIGIPDRILLKPGPLTPEEWEIMRTHAELGYRILSGSSYLHGAAEIIYSHHESYDGSGYPRGLKGDAIPLGARIFMVVDAYDAMRTNRVYREGRPEEAAVKELLDMSGKQFDPAIVQAFIKCRPELSDIYADWESNSLIADDVPTANLLKIDTDHLA